MSILLDELRTYKVNKLIPEVDMKKELKMSQRLDNY
jgi:hypothetical protein